MVDWDALEKAGISDARGRADLIEYLAGLGFTAEEMADAERRGRLFGLAGDAAGQSGPPIYTLRSAADALGCHSATFSRPGGCSGCTCPTRTHPR